MTAEYMPTDAERSLVENAAAFGLTQAEIATQLNIDEKTLRKHFRDELSSGKFKIDMTAGKTLVELMKSRDERVRLDAAKYHTARRMGWKETNVNEHVGRSHAVIPGHANAAQRDSPSRQAQPKAMPTMCTGTVRATEAGIMADMTYAP